MREADAYREIEIERFSIGTIAIFSTDSYNSVPRLVPLYAWRMPQTKICAVKTIFFSHDRWNNGLMVRFLTLFIIRRVVVYFDQIQHITAWFTFIFG